MILNILCGILVVGSIILFLNIVFDFMDVLFVNIVSIMLIFVMILTLFVLSEQLINSSNMQYSQGEKKISQIEEAFREKYHINIGGVYKNNSLVLSIEQPGAYTFVTKKGLFDVYLSQNYQIIFVKKE